MSQLPAASSTPAPLDDDTLIARVAAGDERALEVLYDRYARIAYGLALRVLNNNTELAEDVVQEAFWRVWRRSDTYRAGRGQFVSWLFGIVHHLAIDELRRQQVRPQLVYEQDDRPLLRVLADQRTGVADQVLEDEQRRLIREALDRIPGEQREVIELAFFAGLSQSEIAEHLQNPIGTVKTRVRLGLRKLRELLTAQGIQSEDLL